MTAPPEVRPTPAPQSSAGSHFARVLFLSAVLAALPAGASAQAAADEVAGEGGGEEAGGEEALGEEAVAAGAAEEVASQAQRTHEEHCAQAAGVRDESHAALALAQVGTVWAEVARVHEATGATWLLYWRGLLAQCMGQNERAAEALVKFVESDPTSAGLAAMARDARGRLRRLRPEYAPPKPSRPAPTPEERQRSSRAAGGVVLALGAAGAGIGSGVGFAQFSTTRSVLFTALHPPSESEALIAQGDGQMAAGVALAVGAGVAAAASIAALLGSRRPREAGVALVPAPVAGGVGLVVGGRW